MELELIPAKTGIKNDVIKYAIKNDVMKFAIKNNVINFAITNDVIDKKVKTISCFLTRLRNSRPMFRACYARIVTLDMSLMACSLDMSLLTCHS